MPIIATAAISLSLAFAASGCVTTEAEKPLPLANYAPILLAQKSPDQLRQDLRGFFGRGAFVRKAPYRGADVTWYDADWADASFGADGVSIKFRNAAPNYAYRTNHPDPTHTYRFDYDELAGVAFNAGTCNTRKAPLPHGMELQPYPAVGPELCNTLFSLGQYYENQRKKDDAAFADLAARYRDRPIRPALPEDLRRLIVQAETLRDRKDYDGAIGLLRQALRRDPVVYPAAWFNLALLYEQQEEFGRALDAMKKYLVLQPDAKDARAAQDKIYSWELLAKRP
jgi:tetratricopeptide (TPR) repeat protein